MPSRPLDYNKAQAYPTWLTKAVQAEVGAEADGLWGPVTTGAVEAWQRAHGLTADGKAGRQTLEQMLPELPRAPYDLDTLRTIYPGEYSIDVSHHQGEIDWRKVPADLGVIVKATEGRTYVDPRAHANMQGAGCRLRGVYHMCLLVWRGKVTNPDDQARNVARHVDHDTFVWLDLETKHLQACPAQRRSAWLGRMADECRRLGYDVGWYVSRWGLDLVDELPPAPIWAPYYNPHAQSPQVGDDWALHQITDKGKVPGIKGHVDINRGRP